MEITGTQAIAAPRSAVWDALNDPAVLRRCLPGCESVERTGPEEFRIVLTAAIGPLRARFNSVLRMTEAEPPRSCVMVFEGQGGAIGFGKGTSSVTLGEVGNSTELRYTATAQVGGKLAQVGSRLIDSVARKMSDDFFKAFHKQFAAPQEEQVQAPPAGRAFAGEADAAAAPPSAAMPPASAPGGAAEKAPVMVPGWWLAIATMLGAVAASLGAFAMH